MANITDTLTTLLVLSGSARYVSEMNQVANSVKMLSAEQKGSAMASGEAAGGLAALGAAAGEAAPYLAVVAAVIATVNKGFHEFAAESSQLFRTGIIFRNLGIDLPVERLQAFSDQLSRTTGLSRAELEGAAGILARVGVQGARMPGLLQTIADTARGTGKSVTEVAELIEIGAEGQARGLKRLGVQFEDTGSKAMNLLLIQRQLSRNFGGAGAAFAATPGGAMEMFSESVRKFMAALGGQFAPEIVAVLNAASHFFDFMTAHIQQVAMALRGLTGVLGPVDLLLNRLSGGPSSGSLSPQYGSNPQLDYLRRIADNTEGTQQAIRAAGGQNPWGIGGGGPGEEARSAAGWANLRHAMII